LPQQASVSSVELLPRRPRRGVTRQQLRGIYRQSLDALMKGTLATRKATQTGYELRMAAANSTSQAINYYWNLATNLGGNNNAAIIADQGYVSALTAVYDLTTDPGKTTNLLNAWFMETAQFTLTSAPTAGDTLALQCSYIPYQGMLHSFAGSTGNVGSAVFEVVYFEDTCFYTVAGQYGGGSGSASPLIPIIPKLPLGAAQYAFNGGNTFDCFGATPDASSSQWLKENLPLVQSGDLISASNARFCEGARFSVATALSGQGRGYQQLSPQVRMIGPKLTTVPALANIVAGIAGLVRIVDLPCSDDANFEMGRLFLMVATRINTTADMQAGASSDTSSAVDVFVPVVPNTPTPTPYPSFYEGLVGVQ
jgi:hypothetical protein